MKTQILSNNSLPNFDYEVLVKWGFAQSFEGLNGLFRVDV